MGPERMIKDGTDPAVAYGFDNGMKAEFPVLCSWRDGVRAHAEAGGILDNGFGRHMKADPRSAHTVAPALMGQGTAADILKEWMLKCPRELDQYRLVTVHDEQVFQFPEVDWQEMSRAVVQAAEGEFMGVPILVDQAGPGLSWGEISAK
jgi:DNA polymerase-1